MKLFPQTLVSKESEIVGGLNGVQVSAKLGAATEELHRHSQKYTELFGAWRSDEALLRLRDVTASLTPRLESPYERVVQPNPWATAKGGGDAISVNSKRYLGRVIAVFSGGDGAKYGVEYNPVDDVVDACTRAIAAFGDDVELITGPPKKEQRIMEKALNGNYNTVRDLGRFSLIVGDIKMMPLVLKSLADCPDFAVVRVKNRLDPDHVADDTAGYRDVQVLVREPRGRWIVEIQVIPDGMYKLKKSCGHSGYTKYRFVLEACKRAKFKTAALKVTNARSFLPAPAIGSAATPPTALPAVREARAQDKAAAAGIPTIQEAGRLKTRTSKNAVHPAEAGADAQDASTA